MNSSNRGWIPTDQLLHGLIPQDRIPCGRVWAWWDRRRQRTRGRNGQQRSCRQDTIRTPGSRPNFPSTPRTKRAVRTPGNSHHLPSSPRPPPCGINTPSGSAHPSSAHLGIGRTARRVIAAAATTPTAITVAMAVIVTTAIEAAAPAMATVTAPAIAATATAIAATAPAIAATASDGLFFSVAWAGSARDWAEIAGARAKIGYGRAPAVIQV